MVQIRRESQWNLSNKMTTAKDRIKLKDIKVGQEGIYFLYPPKILNKKHDPALSKNNKQTNI